MKEQAKKNIKTVAIATGVVIGITYLIMHHIAKKQYPHSVYADQQAEQNPVEGKKVVFVENEAEPANADGKCGHLEVVGVSEHIPTFYEKYIKRGFDIVLSFGGLVVLSPIYAVTSFAIKTDDPGPVLFKQKRVAQNKGYFELLKFRSMSVNTPKDVPTHMLQNGGITKVGAFIRKTSIDELPQLWNIFRGNMSVIGPRPALWNQDYLTAERDKYGANDVKPGLTGLAQINGRDELEINEKAKQDGVYADTLKSSSLNGFLMDMKIFFVSIFSVLKHEGIVEGGTGTMSKGFIKTKKLTVGTNTSFNLLKMNTPPLVSVIIATYRRKESLEKAIVSITEQTYSNIEIIVVDDNADKEWNEYVGQIIARCKCNTSLSIIYIKNEQNKGSAETRNVGIEYAAGEFITFLDDDDIYLPRKIQEQLSFMIERELDYSITDLNLYNENNCIIDKRNRKYIKNTDPNVLFRYHLMYHLTGTDTLMFKTSYIKSFGGFSQVNVGDEFYLMEKAIINKGKFGYLSRCDVKAYIHSSTAGLSSGDSKREGENRLYNHKKSYFEQLDMSDIRYINMRHHAVLAFSYLREKNITYFFSESLRAFSISPTGIIMLLINMM